MLVNGKNQRSIRVSDDGKVFVIDQRLLPFEFRELELGTPEDAEAAIKDMAVRGAPLIGVTAAFGLYLAAKKDCSLQYMKEWRSRLLTARPTAVDPQWTIYRMSLAEDAVPRHLHTEFVDRMWKEALLIMADSMEQCRRIGIHGAELIHAISKKKNGEAVHILTHCNAGWLACVDYGTATAPIYMAHDGGLPVHVWVDETRPRNQGGALTAWELGHHGVPHTIIADNTGGHLMQNGMVDMVIVGCDRANMSGDIINKIGTYLKALSAADNGIPFYAAVPLSTLEEKFDFGNHRIEVRSEDEVHFVHGHDGGVVRRVRVTAPGSPAVNYGFDFTPARLMTGFITERGISAADASSLVNMFPELNPKRER